VTYSKYDPRNIAILSSGDPEKDRRDIEDHVNRSMRMDEGFCPNHPENPSVMVNTEPGVWECPNEDCPFVLMKRTLHV
jgi:hypothetical protein